MPYNCKFIAVCYLLFPVAVVSPRFSSLFPYPRLFTIIRPEIIGLTIDVFSVYSLAESSIFFWAVFSYVEGLQLLILRSRCFWYIVLFGKDDYLSSSLDSPLDRFPPHSCSHLLVMLLFAYNQHKYIICVCHYFYSIIPQIRILFIKINHRSGDMFPSCVVLLVALLLTFTPFFLWFQSRLVIPL